MRYYNTVHKISRKIGLLCLTGGAIAPIRPATLMDFSL
jgi:hypothetical protein